MPKFRKKPVVIEAVQWFDTLECFKEVQEFIGDYAQWSVDYGEKPSPLYVHTLEGKMRADQGDWIIKGVNGEFYPCKPDIFAKTYDLVNDSADCDSEACECGLCK